MKRKLDSTAVPRLRTKLRKVGQDWSVVAPDPLTMDGKSWQDVSLGDTLEEILLPKHPKEVELDQLIFVF